MVQRLFAFVLGVIGAASLLPLSSLAAKDDLHAFRALAAAYAARDAEAAGQSYTPDAEVIYRYAGSEEEQYRGRGAITRSFATFFGRIDPELDLDLNFRVAERTASHVSGYYRLRFGDLETSFGRFEVDLAADGTFERDVSYSATRADFESAAGPILVAPDENDLDREYYGLLTGRYRLPDGCDLVVTRSVVRLMVRNSCTQDWRGLYRTTGLVWTAGATVLADERDTKYEFTTDGTRPAAAIAIDTGQSSLKATRSTPYLTEDVRFASPDGTRLAGTIYVPTISLTAGQKLPGVVLVHGSGPQDRDGYASIIAVMADELAANGRIVLTFDKRGTGLSSGDWQTAGFDVLAADAIAGMRLLADRDDVDPSRVGLAGSSQAGWVIAEALRHDVEVSDVFLLGAAGAAFTVAEQNIYNTRVRMKCAALETSSIERALEQQAAFFEALRNPKKAADLDRLTADASSDPAIADWLFPDSSGLKMTDQWFTVLAIHKDPLPVWSSYRGRKVFVFSEFDDSTNTTEALERLAEVGIKTVVLEGAQHIGLRANDLCSAGLPESTGFSGNLFRLLRDFADVPEKAH